jgi:hypothetical protein
MKGCSKCGNTGALVKVEGESLCFICYESQSPFIDEVWRIFSDVINNHLIWVDTESIERRKRNKRFD